MKSTIQTLKRLAPIVFASLIITLSSNSLLAQDDCTLEKDHGQGFSTAISNVTDNGNNSYTIVLDVKSNGCSGSCKAMAHYAVQAQPGTYSDVFVTLISGNLNYNNIDLGPDLGGTPFQGFRITGTSGFGNGNPGEFLVTYTLTGGLQTQQALVKAGNKDLIVTFSAAEFQEFIDCNSSNIFPYYAPPTGGKLVNSLIGPELTSLYNTYVSTGTANSDNIFQIDESTVLIKVFALDGMYNDLLATLTSSVYGMTDPKGIPGQLSISGWFPITNLLLINSLISEVNYARPEYPAQVNSGLVTSQGDIAMRSDIARNAFLLGGENVKVGVISDSYNKKIGNPANDDILKGDLPGIAIDAEGNPVPNPVNSINVDVIKDYPFTGSDEGRAMLQIVHDVAPKAELAFRTGFINSYDFAQGIIELKDAGCDIIVDDITYISEPFFEDGIVAQAVDAVTAEGVAYFTAAGNFGTNSYEDDFHAATPPAGLSGLAHNFNSDGPGENDIYQSISVEEGNYTLVLQWDDGTAYGNTSTDLDIYLANENGSTLFGFNRDNTGGNPIEVLPFTVGPGGATTNLIIIKASGADNLRLKYIVFRGQLTMNEYDNVGKSTIVGHPNAEGAITVGAVLYTNTPEYGQNPPTIASFSSRGGTMINGIQRNKPDITAPNGINTTVEFGSLNLEGPNDPFPNFYGTSAAAPHAAAVAALIIEATDKFYGTNLLPGALKAIITNTAIDMDTPGYDVASGHGFIQADAALLTLANPSPVISDLIYDTTLTPGSDTLLITVLGNYLTEGSQIIFNGVPLESGTTLQGDTAITALIYPFTDLYPSVQVLNPPNPETNGTDGGLSNALYFTDKETVLVLVDNKSKFYGEVLPDFTATYSVVSPYSSIALEEAGLTPEELIRIQSIQFEAVNVNELSNAGLWAITPDANDPLNPASGIEPIDPVDLALLDRFNFVFVYGLLTIDKLDLTIKPQDTTFVYGELISGFNFDYIYNSDNSLEITNNTNMQIRNGLQASHATVLVNAMATALVNASATALVNYSFMVSATALVNNTDLIEFTEVNDTLFNPDGTINATALVNGAAKATVLVNGAAKATVLVNATALGMVLQQCLLMAPLLHWSMPLPWLMQVQITSGQYLYHKCQQQQRCNYNFDG
ncbi:MAG: S8 family serine peptidase [Bacteroidales bacterium]